MPRTARITTFGYVHHVISQFVDKQWLISDDTERAHYIDLLGRSIQQTDWICIAFAVMSNHIHLGLVAGRQPLESCLRSLNSPSRAVAQPPPRSPGAGVRRSRRVAVHPASRRRAPHRVHPQQPRQGAGGLSRARQPLDESPRVRRPSGPAVARSRGGAPTQRVRERVAVRGLGGRAAGRRPAGARARARASGRASSRRHRARDASTMR